MHVVYSSKENKFDIPNVEQLEINFNTLPYLIVGGLCGKRRFFLKFLKWGGVGSK